MGYRWSFSGGGERNKSNQIVSFNLKVWNVLGMIINCCYFCNKCFFQSYKQILSIGSFYVGISLAFFFDVFVEFVRKVMKNYGYLEGIYINSIDSF